MKRARRLFKLLFRFDPELPDDVIEKFASSFYMADPVAEAFVDEVYLKGDAAKGRAMLDKALEEGIEAVPHAPESMKRLFREREVAPTWMIATKWPMARAFFADMAPSFLPSLEPLRSKATETIP